MKDKPEPTFQRVTRETLQDCVEITTQRGTEYLDSWSVENLRTPFLDHTLAAINSVSRVDIIELNPEEKRLIAMATMCDVKLSRLVGPWKKDTVIDLINYVAAFATLREEYAEDNDRSPT